MFIEHIDMFRYLLYVFCMSGKLYILSHFIIIAALLCFSEVETHL